MSDCLNEMELLEYTTPGSAMDEIELIKQQFHVYAAGQ